MESEKQDVGEAIVVEVESNLYSTRDRQRLRTRIEERIAQEGSKHIIVDFSKARWFGAPILDELIISAQMLRLQNRELLLVGSPKINRMLYAARVDRVKLFANVQTALASFGRPVCAAA